jgi:hypothetical protein
MLDQTSAQMVTSVGDEAPPPPPNIPDGKLTDKQVLARARELGKMEGKGDNSRPGIFLITVEGAEKRAITKDHVATIFDEYSRASAAARGVGWKRQDSEKQQLAKLGVAVRLGELPHVSGMKLMETVVAMQKEQRAAQDGKMDYSPFDGMVLVGRYQITKSPGAILSDDVVRGLLIKPAKDLPEEADILERHMKALNGAADAKKEGSAVSDPSRDVLRQAASLLAQRIAELGGSTADRKARAKAETEVVELVARAEVAKAALANIVVRTE